MKKTLSASALATAFLILGHAAPARATATQFDLDNVAFTDGSTLTGSVYLDLDTLASGWTFPEPRPVALDITLTASPGSIFTDQSFLSDGGGYSVNDYNPGHLSVWASNAFDYSVFLAIAWPVDTTASDPLDLSGTSFASQVFYCAGAGCADGYKTVALVSGSLDPVAASSAPEPATIALFSASLLGLGLTRRRRT